MHEYEQKFAELPEQQKLTKLCSNAGFSKNMGKGQFFITLDEDGPDDMKTSCREYTLTRNEETSRVRGWIRGNTKIGPVLDEKVCYHQGCCGVEIKIGSFVRDRRTVSWVRIVNGINKYVTATSEEVSVASVENRGTGKPVAKAKPQPTPTLTWSPVSILHRERKSIEVDPGNFSQGCFEVSKLMIRLFRHDDGVVRFDDLGTKVQGKV